MGKFVINTHGRLQEWIADAKGYFRDEGLDYELTQHTLLTKDAPERFKAGSSNTVADNLDGAYQTYESGREASISCACHWTVNMAASNAHGRMVGDAYSVTPCGIFVPENSSIRAPADLAGVNVHVGNLSGSHYTAIQALEVYLPGDQIKACLRRQPLGPRGPAPRRRRARRDAVWHAGLHDGAVGLSQNPRLQLHDRRVDSGRRRPRRRRQILSRAAPRAGRHRTACIRPTRIFTPTELPARFADRIDVRRFGPGERIVFEPYSREMFEETHKWVEERAIFAADKVGRGGYEDSIALVA